MPHCQSSSSSLDLELVELHPTFAAEVRGVDFSRPIPDDEFAKINAAIAKYGVLVFRNTGLDDERHIAFSRQFGELDDVTPYLKLGRKPRLPHMELFDISNIDVDGSIFPTDSMRTMLTKGNAMFHVDSSFNPRRAAYSLLLAHKLPPKGTGGATDFADLRTAYETLPPALKNELLTNNYVARHSLIHSRKIAAPEAGIDEDPEKHFMSRHHIVQTHHPSGRPTLYIAAHVHSIEDVAPTTSERIISQTYSHACDPKLVVSVEWENESDLMVWDNVAVMHRATGGSYVGKYSRDVRRTTVHDSSVDAWGLNERTTVQTAF